MKPDSPELMVVIRKWADAHDLDPALVWAVVAVESNSCESAVRFETGYKYLFDPARVRPVGCSVETETALQKMSWGLMQVMGAVLREKGFKGWLTEILTDVDAQVEYGCRHLAGLVKRWGIPGGVAAYNAGSPRKDSSGNFENAEYVSKVLAKAEGFRTAADARGRGILGRLKAEG